MASTDDPTGSKRSGASSDDPGRSGDSDPGRVADSAKAQARGVWDSAREGAKSSIEKGKDDVAAGIGGVAGALKNSAESMDGSSDNDVTAQLVRRAADGLDSFSNALRGKDLNTLVRDAESFARRQPALFLGAAVAAGFLAMRFLRSSQRADTTARPDSGAGYDPSGTEAGAPADPRASDAHTDRRGSLH